MHLSAHTWMRPESLRRTLERISELGYTSVELAGEPSLYPIEETRQLLCEYNVKCWGTVTLQHGTRDLTTADPAHRKTTIQYMKDVVSMAAELGGTIVTVVPARVGKLFPSSSLENEWKWAVEGLREVAVLAKEKNIRVGIEPLNRFETYFLNRVDQTLALADAVGHDCGITFDPSTWRLKRKTSTKHYRKPSIALLIFMLQIITALQREMVILIGRG
ncbi:uncharacterized protein TrAFT101_006371 [Trichoderma asperellum]|uniref:uncharacterized protein n=1 Tax=Trichoderma asperellum TaxID=101201 RepID=UPI00331A7B0C|nr:hypothetical protein TrAFT101_006371 [Trichoderma asperellum]